MVPAADADESRCARHGQADDLDGPSRMSVHHQRAKAPQPRRAGVAW